MQRPRIGIVLIAVLFVLLYAGKPEPPPPRIVLPAEPMKKSAMLLRVIADELDGAADATDFEEHLIKRCETIFDRHARDFDFPGPNVLTRPLARRAIRPVVKALVRYATDEKHFNEEENHDQ